jgi:hypothetical protein
LAERQANCTRWQVWQELDSAAFLARLDSATVRTGFTPAAFTPFKEILLSPARPLTPASAQKLLGDMATLGFFRIGEDCYTVLSLKDLPDNFSLEGALGPDLAERAFLLEPAIMEQEVTTFFHAETPLILLSMLSCFAMLCLSQRSSRRILVMAFPRWPSSWPPCCSLPPCDKAFTLTSRIAVPIVAGAGCRSRCHVQHALGATGSWTSRRPSSSHPHGLVSAWGF